MTRQRLPNRREHELLTYEHEGIRYTAGIGRFADGGLAEIFLNAAKHGTAVDVNACDAAVAASLLLQHGCQLDTLRRALIRNSDGSPSGPLVHALELLAERQYTPSAVQCAVRGTPRHAQRRQSLRGRSNNLSVARTADKKRGRL